MRALGVNYDTGLRYDGRTTRRRFVGVDAYRDRHNAATLVATDPDGGWRRQRVFETLAGLNAVLG